MENDVNGRIDECLRLTYRLEKLAEQDARDMENCTKGQVLAEYRAAMDVQIRRLRQIERILGDIRQQ